MYWQKYKKPLSEKKRTPKISEENKETPLMLQYNSFKAKYPDAILLFRIGDFYETFGEDAIKTSKALGIILTKRANGAASHIELSGFPHHALDTYLPKLVRAGYRVAICDQLEDPKLAKKIVKRGVTELVTPGIALSDKILDHKQNNFLAAIHFSSPPSFGRGDGGEVGISFLDVSTGEFMVAQGNSEYIEKLLQGLKPSEILFQKHKQKDFIQHFGNKFYTYTLEDWVFQNDFAIEKLLKHFETNSLKGFGVDEMNSAIIAAGAILHYLSITEHIHTKHINSISRIEEEKYVWLDKFSIRNLELVYSQNENATPLIKVIDQSISPMGSRLMRRWLVMPLKEKLLIEERLEIVEYLIKNAELRKSLTHQIHLIGDLERLISKVPLKRINPREVLQIKKALFALEEIQKELEKTDNLQLKKVAEQINCCKIIRERIANELKEDAPWMLNKGGVISNNVNPELDDLRKITTSGKEYLLEIQKREVEKTGISSLKINFNNVFGYFLEVTNAHKSKVPPEWIRKQTLSNAERYITDELKNYEEKILGAEEKIISLETKLFEELVLSLHDYIHPIQLNSSLVARLDCLLSFANLAVKNNYRRPEISDDFILDIKDGRHPVIEQQMNLGEQYVPNDIFLDNEEQQIIIITGPNMAGKSALLRQTALIVLMAQMGSFVPASSAKIGLIDKIFTRVGASDNISSGESTFMVEMNETASIINNISNRSLILLDEIGRGTSTYDGISIAWSIAEFLHNTPHRPKTLFATHYHELNELEEKFERIKNYNVSTKEAGNKVIFLRKLIPGGSKHSFGIQVAKMAGMPKTVVDRANEIMHELEQKHIAGDIQDKLKKLPQNFQMNIFQMDDPKLVRIRELLINFDVNTLTPVEALMKLNEIQSMLKE